MKNDPWIKLILVSLGGIVISLSLLWSLQQYNSYSYYNGSQMQSGMSGTDVQKGINMQNDNDQTMGHSH